MNILPQEETTVVVLGCRVKNKKPSLALKERLDKTYQYLKNRLDEQEFNVLKPMPSPIDKIQNRYRWRIIIKGNITEEANKVINDCLKIIYDRNYKNTRVAIDVNPNSML